MRWGNGPFGRLLDRVAGGHVTLGPVTVYGRNAMHYAVNIRTRTGWICFRLPLTCYGRWWPLYAYVSGNATPWHHTARGWHAGRGELTPGDCVCDDCRLNGRGRFSDPREYANLGYDIQEGVHGA